MTARQKVFSEWPVMPLQDKIDSNEIHVWAWSLDTPSADPFQEIEVLDIAEITAMDDAAGMAQGVAQPRAERGRQALEFSVERVQVGVEVLTRAVHPLVGVRLIDRRPVSRKLTQVGEGDQHGEFGLHQRGVVAQLG